MCSAGTHQILVLIPKPTPAWIAFSIACYTDEVWDETKFGHAKFICMELDPDMYIALAA